HCAYVFSALKEMPPLRRFRTDEPRQVKGVIGIRKNQEVFFRTTHDVSLARVIVDLFVYLLRLLVTAIHALEMIVPTSLSTGASAELKSSWIGNWIVPASFGRHSLCLSWAPGIRFVFVNRRLLC